MWQTMQEYFHYTHHTRMIWLLCRYWWYIYRYIHVELSAIYKNITLCILLQRNKIRFADTMLFFFLSTKICCFLFIPFANYQFFLYALFVMSLLSHCWNSYLDTQWICNTDMIYIYLSICMYIYYMYNGIINALGKIQMRQ